MAAANPKGSPDQPPYQPAGYCCHCGYRLDPGRCPECGNDVPPDSLLLAPPPSPYWGDLRRVFLALMGGVLICGAYWLWLRLEAAWTPMYPCCGPNYIN